MAASHSQPQATLESHNGSAGTAEDISALPSKAKRPKPTSSVDSDSSSDRQASRLPPDEYEHIPRDSDPAEDPPLSTSGLFRVSYP
jgi:hypothetical protein